MFKFLKDKLKGVLSKLTGRIEQEAQEDVVEVEKEVPVEPPKPASKAEKKPEPKAEKKPEPRKAPEKETPRKARAEQPREELKPGREPEKPAPIPVPAKVAPQKPAVQPEPPKAVSPAPQVEAATPAPNVERKPEPARPAPPPLKTALPAPAPEPEKKKGFFGRIFQKVTETVTTKRLDARQFEELFWDLELALLENNVAVEVVEKIKADLGSAIIDRPIPRGKVEETLAESLRGSISSLFEAEPFDLVQVVRKSGKRPYVICFVGVNGSGKTTSIAKLAHFLQKQGLGVVIAAADTFRAAAIDQLEQHASNLNVKLIKHDYGADAAAVAFDAIKHAEAKGKDVVLIDTAGRLHSNANLMDEMKKIVRVAKPDLTLFIGEAITGNDCVEQARKFDEAVGIHGIILAKADIDEKGGAAVSISYVTRKPILYLGMGQGYDDFQPFDKELILKNLGLG
jgi:fused signal recognition particle receptor